jgi:Ser/Thr protein kinase RdoA (MazF antagonist)
VTITVPSIVYFPRPGRLTAHVQSRLRPPDVALSTVEAILNDDYGVRMTAPPENLPNTRRNRNLVVYTTDGKKVFKLYRRDWQPETIEFEHAILLRLAELHSPAPRLTPTSDGRTWVGGRPGLRNDRYCLFEFIDGVNYSSAFLLRAHRLRLTALLGEVLARTHWELAGFLPPGRDHLGFAAYNGPRHRDLAWHAIRLAELSAASVELPDPTDHSHAAWLVARSGYILEEMTRLDEVLNGAGLPRLIIHGDYGLHNLLVHAIDRATPVDFELARLEWRLSDLASCLSKMRFAAGTYDFESMRQFMSGYRAVYPIGREEWQWFPDALKYYRLMSTVQYWNSYFETGGPTRKLLSARDAFTQANWGWDYPRIIDELGAS